MDIRLRLVRWLIGTDIQVVANVTFENGSVELKPGPRLVLNSIFVHTPERANWFVRFWRRLFLFRSRRKRMSISDLIIKVIGVVLAIVGFALLMSTVGIGVFGIGLSPVWLAILVGLLFLAVGIWLVRGGAITL